MTRAAHHACLGALLLVLTACQATVRSELTEEQANRAIATLDEHGIAARKETHAAPGRAPSFALTVDPEEVAPALAVLARQGLPEGPPPGLEDVFGGGSLVPTATEERARLTLAIGGELARTLESIDGVVTARVHVALPEGTPLLVDTPLPTARASVLVRHRGDRPPLDETSVARLVAGAVQGLDRADVAVVFVRIAPAEPPAAAFAQVGPLSVARRSASTLRGLLALLLCTNLVLATLLGAFVLRRRRAGLPPEGGAP